MKIIKCIDGRYIRRVSKWIKVEYRDVTPRHSLYDYAEHDGENHTVLCFRFNNRLYSIDQFINCGFSGYWYEDTEGKQYYIGYYDGEGCLYHPLLIECDECGEHVRVYSDDVERWEKWEYENGRLI